MPSAESAGLGPCRTRLRRTRLRRTRLRRTRLRRTRLRGTRLRGGRYATADGWPPAERRRSCKACPRRSAPRGALRHTCADADAGAAMRSMRGLASRS
ncbi:pentapeptide repeat-containing protein [Streptomyces sp. NPDC006385]|uniref:pentapeptide repeat-containing protein n=1 Tax=Streptomyces sp. NPDC006385 TaxID=3156761 RepID=UPI0033A636E0